MPPEPTSKPKSAQRAAAKPAAVTRAAKAAARRSPAPPAPPPPETTEAQPAPVPEDLAYFVRHMQSVRRQSPLTVKGYLQDITHFMHHWRSARELAAFRPEAVQVADVRLWLRALYDDDLQPASIARKLSAVRAYYRWRVRTERQESDPTARLRPPKAPKILPRVLSPDDAARLVEAPEGEGPAALRDRAILELAYGAGLRVSELVDLNVRDLDRALGTVRVTGKGNKTRVVPVGRTALAALNAWLGQRAQLRGPQGLDPYALFLNTRGGRLSVRSVQRLVVNSRAACQEGRVTPHWLRHACATHMLGSGADLRAIQEQLGHASLRTTQRYTHVDVAALMKAYDQAHPRAHSEGGAGDAEG